MSGLGGGDGSRGHGGGARGSVGGGGGIGLQSSSSAAGAAMSTNGFGSAGRCATSKKGLVGAPVGAPPTNSSKAKARNSYSGGWGAERTEATRGGGNRTTFSGGRGDESNDKSSVPASSEEQEDRMDVDSRPNRGADSSAAISGSKAVDTGRGGAGPNVDKGAAAAASSSPGQPRPAHGQTRSAPFDASRDETSKDGDAAPDRGGDSGKQPQREGRPSLGAESSGGGAAPSHHHPTRRGGSRDDFGMMSLLAEAGAELGGVGIVSGNCSGTGGASSGGGVGGSLGVGGVGKGRFASSVVGVSGVLHPFAGKEPGSSASGAAGAASFLDALSEEERRVRTRHLPGVEGFRVLHRSEIKRDLALARAALRSRGGNGGSVGGSSNNNSNGGGSVSSGPRGKRRGSGLDAGAVASSDKEGGAGSGGGSEENAADAEEDEGTVVSDYDTTSDASGGGGIAPGSKAPGSDGADDGLADAFVPPLDDFVTALTGGGSAASVDGVEAPPSAPSSHAQQPPNGVGGPRYPHIIESITAFDPPRPPESIAPKKKHRLLRWERRPSDVEVDLASYRKTVRRTREELHRAECDRERIEVTGAHLRLHFLSHLRDLREESGMLDMELGVLQDRCLEASELLTNKTRSRGAGRGPGDIMRDVLAALKARGVSGNGVKPQRANGDVSAAVTYDTEPERTWCVAGIGGVSGATQNLDFGSTEGVPSIARGWLLPGDRVSTPFGPGTVVRVYGPSALDVNEPVPDGVIIKQNYTSRTMPRNQLMIGGMAQRHGFGGVAASFGGSPTSVNFRAPLPVPSAGMGGGIHCGKSIVSPMAMSKLTPFKSRGGSSSLPPPRGKDPTATLAARVCVCMSFGAGYFTPDSLGCLENPASYSDDKLLARWRKMIQTAHDMAGYVDVAGMGGALGLSRSSSAVVAGTESESSCGEGDGDKGADTAAANGPQFAFGGDAHHVDSHVGVSPVGNSRRNICRNRVLPVGSSMLRSPGLTGYLLSDAPLDFLESNVKPVLFDGGGVLGRNGNPGVPPDFKSWEDQRYEVLSLRGRVMQLRNQLYRQRRIRILNERSRISGQERAERFESLLAEMKSDLTSLKERLQDELIELGIDQEKAEDLLASYITEHEDASVDDEMPKKQHWKSSDDFFESDALPSRGGDNSLEDEATLRKSNKRGRVEGDTSIGAESNKPRRTGYRRQ